MGEPPEVISPLTDETFKAPHPATLQCTINPGKPSAKTKWFKDGKELYSGSKYEMSYSRQDAQLVVYDTDTGDAGKYKCEATNEMGRCHTSAVVTVHGKRLVNWFTHRLIDSYWMTWLTNISRLTNW